ncbi:MAG: CHASE2 and HATPase_c domain-containing protein [Sulfuricella sp.]|nr:CHASE2 and HATPase_c domain-containing protein [Sulfuricella sp.]
MPSAMARFVRLIWVSCTSLALAWALSLTPGYQRLEWWALDAQQRIAAERQTFTDAVIVEIDEASLRELQPFFGAWPWRRDAYALALDYLGDIGARSVTFDILFSEPRGGETEFHDALSRNRNAILAASALNRAADNADIGRLAALGWPARPPLPAMRWTAAALPLAGFADPSASGRVGMSSVAVAADGVLRNMPLMHEIGGVHLPSLALASLFPGGAPQVEFSAGANKLRIGGHAWPVNGDGAVRLLFPPNADPLPIVPFSAVAAAALGMPGRTLDPALFAGKTVFIGNTALFSDRVNTPRGNMNGVHVMAIAYEGLLHDLVVRPQGWGWGSLLLLLAALPGAIQPALRRTSAAVPILVGAAGAMVLLGVNFALFRVLHQQGMLLLPLLAVALSTLFGVGIAVREKAWRRADDAIARADSETELARKQQRFVAMVSHEFRTPLAIIDASLQSLKRLARHAPDEVLTRHRKIQRANRRLEALINNHLTEDRLRRAAHPPRMEAVDLHELLARTARRAEWPELELRTEGLHSRVWGDEELLRIVFSNLLDNAMKYSPDGGRISVGGETMDGFAEVRIADSGIGIAAHDLTHVFDQYFRVQGTKAAGSGLGLYLVRQIVELHGGSIRAESAPGQGTRMIVRLPLAAASGE